MNPRRASVAPPLTVTVTVTLMRGAGGEVRGKILANAEDNPKLRIPCPGTPFHAYYKGQVAKIRQGDDGEGDKEEKPTATVTAAAAAPQEQREADQTKKFVPPVSAAADAADALDAGKPPAPEQYTIHAPDGISTSDFELMKVSAQFVARNGKGFLTALSSEKASDPMFAFLKPTHSLHKFFMSMTGAYARVFSPPASLLIGLKKDALSKTPCLRRAMHRLEYEREREREGDARRARGERGREAMLSTDWQPFVVVETIEFEMGEEVGLPRPMTLKDALRAARKLRLEAGRAEEGKQGLRMSEEDARLVEAGRRAAQGDGAVADGDAAGVAEDKPQVVENVADDEETIRVVKNYKRGAFKKPGQGPGGYDPTKYVISPLTGELVEINAMAEHMRVSLIDPRWKTQREAMLAKMKGSAKASDDEIGRNLSLLAQRRPDVFGDRDALLKALGGEDGDGDGHDIKRQRKA